MPTESQITVLIAEDQAVTRFGLRLALEAYPDFKVVGETADGVSAVLQSLATKPSVILMDIGLPKLDGIQASKQIKEALPGTRIIMFTASSSDEHIMEALAVGVDGYCLKSVIGEHLCMAIRAVSQGATWLDPGIAQKILLNQKAVQTSAPESASSNDEPVRGTASDTANQNISGQNISGQNGSGLNSKQLRILKLLSDGASLDEVNELLGSPVGALNKDIKSILNLVAEAMDEDELTVSTGQATSTENQTAEVKTETIIGERYVVEGVLGRGGMGIVYRGRHKFMDRPVAIKMLHPEFALDEQVVKRFEVEARTLCNISHPNLVSVFDFGVTKDNDPFMVMDFHDGKSLEAILIKYGVLPIDQGINIFSQVLDALEAVHNAGVVHRDVKPGNIIVSFKPDVAIKLVDFGIAKQYSGLEKQLKLTATGAVMGTPRYMSPEQCVGKTLDARTDIYALGCVMYESFTGHSTYSADSFYELVQKHLHENPSRLPFLQPGVSVPEKLIDVIFRALKKSPLDRYQSAQSMKQALLEARQLTA